MRVTMTATLRMKHSFSRQHLVAARHFAHLATEAEEQNEVSRTLKTEHRAYVTGAIVFSVAFLEASINELYLEAVDINRTTLSTLTDPQFTILAELWPIVEQTQALGKFQIVLASCGCSRFDKGVEPFQGVDSLIKIRNALIHYRPEWDNELDEHKKIHNRVSNKFALNPFTDKSSLWFPHQCLGAGCAKWGIGRVEQFIVEFCQRLGIPSRLP